MPREKEEEKMRRQGRRSLKDVGVEENLQDKHNWLELLRYYLRDHLHNNERFCIIPHTRNQSAHPPHPFPLLSSCESLLPGQQCVSLY